MKWPATRIATQNCKSFGMYEKAMLLAAEGKPVIHLEIGRPSFDTPLHIKEAAKTALDNGIVHYGELKGSGELRRAISNKLRTFNDITADEEDILITNGLTHAAFAVFMAGLNEGDEVIILEPFYPQHNSKIELLGAKVVSVPHDKQAGFRIDPARIEQKITAKTRMLVIINPVNPLGRVYTLEELSSLAAIAVKHDLLVISDEVYEYIVYDDHKHISIATLPGMKERTISLFAFTKAYAMDGWRMGYAVAERTFIDSMLKVTLNDATHPNVFAQVGACAAVNGSQDCIQEMLAEDERRRDLVYERLNDMPGVSCPKPEGTIYAFPDFSALDKPSVQISQELLETAHVATEAGSFYGASGEGHIRICFGAESYGNIEKAMDSIAEYAKNSV